MNTEPAGSVPRHPWGACHPTRHPSLEWARGDTCSPSVPLAQHLSERPRWPEGSVRHDLAKVVGPNPSPSGVGRRREHPGLGPRPQAGLGWTARPSPLPRRGRTVLRREQA